VRPLNVKIWLYTKESIVAQIDIQGDLFKLFELQCCCFFTETFRQIGLFIDEHFGRENVAERRKGLPQVVVTEFLRQVVNKQIGALWTFLLTQSAHQRTDAAARSASGAAYAAAAASAAAAWRRPSETRIG
jgi:hypothetical protein